MSAHLVPYLEFEDVRFPIHGGLLQRRGGTARHDAVVWGYARGADRRGVDIVQNCEVTGIQISAGRVTGVETTRGVIRANKIALAVAGSSSRVAAMAGLAAADRKSCAAGVRFGGHQAAHRSRHHFRRRTLLHQPIRQGRSGVRRRHRRLQFLRPARQPADGRGRVRGRHGDHAGDRTRAYRALLGRPRGYVDGRLADHRSDVCRRTLSQRGLVLRRLQSDTRHRVGALRI